MKTKRKRVPPKVNRGALHGILQALQEIEAHFELEGFASDASTTVDRTTGTTEVMEPTKAHDENDEYNEGEESIGNTTFDREDIEVGIDVCISELVTQHVISKARLSKRPSLSDVFQTLFGEDHKVVEHARLFEEHIKGYFDIVAYDEMAAAHDELVIIQDIIKRELGNDT